MGVELFRVAVGTGVGGEDVDVGHARLVQGVAVGGGQVEANIQRWVGQFQNEGREVTVQQGKAGENNYIIVDVSGTYKKPDGPPVLGKTKPVKGYQMLGVILLDIKSSEVFYLKLTGPRKTITAAADVYRASFGGSTQNEKPLSTKD